MTATNSPSTPSAPCKLQLMSNPSEIGFLGKRIFDLDDGFVELGDEVITIVKESGFGSKFSCAGAGVGIIGVHLG